MDKIVIGEQSIRKAIAQHYHVTIDAVHLQRIGGDKDKTEGDSKVEETDIQAVIYR